MSQCRPTLSSPVSQTPVRICPETPKSNKTEASVNEAFSSLETSFSQTVELSSQSTSPPNQESSNPLQAPTYGYLDPIYSRRKPATEKMRDSLRFAVEQGKKNTREMEFEFDPRSAVDAYPYIDQGIDDSSYGAAARRTRRAKRIRSEWQTNEMEDRHFVQTLNFNNGSVKAKLATVCDGHKDRGQIGEHLKEELGKALEDELHAFDDETIGNTLTRLMVNFDQKLRAINGGTTLTAALIFDTQIFIFNVGDSRTILCKKDAVYQLSEDAKPYDERFKTALEEHGVKIQWGRVEGRIRVARDIGLDILSPRPKITRILRGNEEDDLDKMTLYCPKGSYLILASDGLWDVAPIHEVQQAVWQMDEKKLRPAEIAAHLAYRASTYYNFKKGIKNEDDVTVVVIKVE